ncbi:NACHT domain-containing protein [Nonomuraea sp. NPDC049141]|uniref:NACHT domain-containing protein n=1 Tax=Nonomuraea sp. NPDC049141 TaxID=3155500 RepID=UPI0033CAB694
MSRRKAGWRIAVAVLALVVVGAAVVAVWRARTPGAEVNLADVVAVALAGATLIGAVVAWALRSPPAATLACVVDADAGACVDVDAAAQVLAGLVERQWRTEAGHRLLDDPEPIPVHWQLIADETVMSQPRLITAGAELTFTGRANDIVALADAFRGLTRRRLVIVGGAGMGKTTLAIQLLLQLLSTRAADQSGACEGEIVPVPVLLPVSGWDMSIHARLQDWLAVRLAQDYPALAAPQLGAGAAAALAEGGHILPVLDGLDEIPAPTRAQVIAALNDSLTARDQLILTSRRAEFTTAIRGTGRPLTAAAVIVPKPLTPQAAADYLTACLPASLSDAWAQALAALRSRTAPGLTRLAATPLGLWLIRTVYLAPGADPAPLTGPLGCDSDALRAHLLDLLIPAVIQARPPSTDRADHFRPRHRLDSDATRRHLTYLARAFPPAATRDITWWHIARTTPHIRAIAGLAAGLVFWLAASLAVGVGLGLGLGSGLMVGLVVGFMLGFVLVLVFPRSSKTPGYANLRLRGRTPLLLRSIKGRLEGVLALRLLLVLVITLLVGPRAGLAVGLAAGLVMGLGVTLAFGLIDWGEQPTLISTSTPRSSWQADRALTLLRMVVFGFPMGLAMGLAGVLAMGLAAGLAFGLAGMLVVGLAGGLLVGKHHAWLVCTIAVARLALQHRLPWQVMDFLDDAHRLGLLRAVGPVYQFRHAALHDHLAAANATEAAS